MKKVWEIRAILCAAIMGILFWSGSTLTLAAARPIQLEAIRSSQAIDKDRVVFQFTQMPVYQVESNASGTEITLHFSGTAIKPEKEWIKPNSVIKAVRVENTQDGTRVFLNLWKKCPFKVHTLSNPARIYIDFAKYYEYSKNKVIQPGVLYTEYAQHNASGNLRAYLLTVDPKKVDLIPALGGYTHLGRNTVLCMAENGQALAAINASYFGRGKEVYGLTKIDGVIASTTYLPRTAFGVDKSGQPIIDTVNYRGEVILPDKEVLPIAGVNVARSANTLVLYNHYYGSSTGTNEYGVEYTIRNGEVIAKHTANSPLIPGEYVLSAHGNMQIALAKLRVGDKVILQEDLGPAWQNAWQILGVGPRLLRDGQVDITAREEHIGPDVYGGVSPRTAVAVTRTGEVILAVIDGRSRISDGLTLNGLAHFLMRYGAWNAVNFDGGGSSEMVLHNKIVNRPSDGGERAVGTALLVRTK